MSNRAHLEAEVAAAPFDAGRRHILADFLSEDGDARQAAVHRAIGQLIDAGATMHAELLILTSGGPFYVEAMREFVWFREFERALEYRGGFAVSLRRDQELRTSIIECRTNIAGEMLNWQVPMLYSQLKSLSTHGILEHARSQARRVNLAVAARIDISGTRPLPIDLAAERAEITSGQTIYIARRNVNRDGMCATCGRIFPIVEGVNVCECGARFNVRIGVSDDDG